MTSFATAGKLRRRALRMVAAGLVATALGAGTAQAQTGTGASSGGAGQTQEGGSRQFGQSAPPQVSVTTRSS
jgi:hypothetical protein